MDMEWDRETGTRSHGLGREKGQVQRLRDINTDRVIWTERQKWEQSHTNVNYNVYQLEMLHTN